MPWEVVIGLETHVQLATHSKIFSGASTAFGAPANTQASAVDLALPGTLPVCNRTAVEYAIRFGLAVGAHVAPRSVFARKNYFYPDLPKGYQVSQFEIPVVQGGEVAVAWQANDAAGKPATFESTVHLTRAHLEEDAGKSLHEDFQGMSGIDLNRAGTPLLEIVTEPDMRSAAEAVAYAKTLHGLVTWLGICDGNMQEGSFRCDANVSVRPKGQEAFGTRCEIKNLNSFRFLERAIEFEVRRQIELIEDGGKVVQETRLYDPDRDETRSMRSKEDAHDYRYFPDPDLPDLIVSADWVERVRGELPELPAQMRERFVQTWGLTPYDAVTLTGSREQADFFVALSEGLSGVDKGAAIAAADAKLAANWTMGEVAARLNREGAGFDRVGVTPQQLAGLLVRVRDGTVSGKIARDVFGKMWEADDAAVDLADRIIDREGLRQIQDSGEIERIVDEVVAANPKSVDEFRAGKEKALNALVGQVMKASKGKANPQQASDLLRKRLGQEGA